MSDSCQPIPERPIDEQLQIFRTFADEAEMGFGIARMDTSMVYVNAKLSEMVELPVSELLGKSFERFYSSEQLVRLHTVIIPAIMETGRWTGELELHTASGTLTPTRESYVLIRGDDGEPLYIAALVSDVSDYKSIEEKLRDHQIKLEALVSQRTRELEAANEKLHSKVDRLEIVERELQHERDFSMNILNRTPAIVCGIDGDGKTTFINPAGERITGFCAAEIIGKNWWETFYPGDHYEQVEQLFTAFSDGEVRDYKMTLVDRVGKEHVISWNSINTYAEDGSLIEVIGMGHDVTEHVRAQESLRVSEDKYRALYYNSRDAYMIVSPEEGFIDCNDATTKLFGCRDMEQFTTFTPADLSPERQLDGALSAAKAKRMMTIAYENGSHRFEWRHRKMTGEEFDTVVLLNRLDFSDKPMMQATVRDVTEQRHVQERLRHVEKLDSIGKLAGGVAHDFNNMLGGISGAAELLERKLDGNDELLEFVKIIQDATDRAAELTQKLLVFSRKAKVNNEPFDVHTSILEALSILERSIDRRIVSSPNLMAEQSTVEGDSNQLQNVILNLGLNARDAMPDGGRMRFSTTNVELDVKFCAKSEFDVTPGTYIEIDVQDTGCGIDDSVLPHVFEPFFTTKEVGKGTGLGLSAVYGTIKDHNGMISVSTEDGVGTLFKIYLPVNVANVQPPKATVQESTPGSGTILLVDDEEIIRLMGKAMLKSMGYSVLLASDGIEAIETYEANMDAVDAVVLDMVMPRMNGSDTFRAMKKIDEDVKIIFCSGFSREQCVDDLMNDGAIAFLQKPYKKSELGKVLKECLSQSTSRV